MVSCSACGYSLTRKSRGSGITFHYFPKDEDMRKKWIKFMKRPDWTPKPTSYLCSQHFTAECFDRPTKHRVRLCYSAIPTIEVERLRYARHDNPVCVRPSVDTIEINASNYDEMTPKYIALSAPETNQMSFCTVAYTSEEVEENNQKTLKIKHLEGEITELHKRDKLKYIQIRRLQKIMWYQRKRISSLTAKLSDMKKRNRMLEKQVSTMHHDDEGTLSRANNHSDLNGELLSADGNHIPKPERKSLVLDWKEEEEILGGIILDEFKQELQNQNSILVNIEVEVDETEDSGLCIGNHRYTNNKS